MAYRHRRGFDGKMAVGIIMLFVPAFRMLGALWLCVRIKKQFNLSGKNMFWLIFLTLALCSGGLGEILGLIDSLAIPLAIIAIMAIAFFMYMNASQERFTDYASCIGDRAVISFDALESALGVSENRLKKDIKIMRKKGMLPKNAYIDLGHRCVVLKPEGRPKDEPPKAENKEKPFEEDVYTRTLKQIRHLNDEIADEKLSAQIDHIENTTANIFYLVSRNPERVSEIQTFLEYYLPTTLKLLDQYAQLERQGKGGENIQSARRRIEEIMEKLVEGFDAQLDKLFKKQTIDITNDVNVLDKMMRMEGLTHK